MENIGFNEDLWLKTFTKEQRNKILQFIKDRYKGYSFQHALLFVKSRNYLNQSMFDWIDDFYKKRNIKAYEPVEHSSNKINFNSSNKCTVCGGHPFFEECPYKQTIVVKDYYTKNYRHFVEMNEKIYLSNNIEDIKKIQKEAEDIVGNNPLAHLLDMDIMFREDGSKKVNRHITFKNGIIQTSPKDFITHFNIVLWFLFRDIGYQYVEQDIEPLNETKFNGKQVNYLFCNLTQLYQITYTDKEWSGIINPSLVIIDLRELNNWSPRTFEHSLKMIKAMRMGTWWLVDNLNCPELSDIKVDKIILTDAANNNKLKDVY